MRVLVAATDPGLRSLLARELRGSGYVVDAAEDGGQVRELLGGVDYQVAVLDWSLAGACALDVVRGLRGRGSLVPVLLLTHRRVAEDRVAALDAGADDCLEMPVAAGELSARIRALSRRSPCPHAPLSAPP